MLPVVMGLAWARNLSPSKLLIPLSVASLLGGMLTLIGTAPNIVVSNHLLAMGREPFSFFAFTPIGASVVVVGIGFMALVGRGLLPERPSPGGRGGAHETLSMNELAGSWALHPHLYRLRIPADSSFVGERLGDLALPDRYEVTVLEILDAEDGRGAPLRRARQHSRRPWPRP